MFPRCTLLRAKGGHVIRFHSRRMFGTHSARAHWPNGSQRRAVLAARWRACSTAHPGRENLRSSRNIGCRRLSRPIPGATSKTSTHAAGANESRVLPWEPNRMEIPSPRGEALAAMTDAATGVDLGNRRDRRNSREDIRTARAVAHAERTRFRHRAARLNSRGQGTLDHHSTQRRMRVRWQGGHGQCGDCEGGTGADGPRRSAPRIAGRPSGVQKLLRRRTDRCSERRKRGGRAARRSGIEWRCAWIRHGPTVRSP